MKSIGAVPVQVPGWAVSVLPSAAVPVMLGAVALTGGAAVIAAVGVVGTSPAMPTLLDALTSARIVAPMSAAVNV